MTKTISSILLKIICCPIDKANLEYDATAATLTCSKCKFVYPIREGIPILLPPEMHDEKDKARSRNNGWKS